MQLLRGQHRKAPAEVEPHLVAENAQRAGTGAVVLAVTMFENMSDEIEVGLHAIGGKVTLWADKW